MRQTGKNSGIAKQLQKVGEAFRIPGLFFSYEEIKMGNVNLTYKVNYVLDNGTGNAHIKSYLVQKINTNAFKKPLDLMINIDKVTTYIRQNNPNRVTVHFHHTESGKNYLEDENGFWRLSNYIPSATFNKGDNIRVVRYAGEAFGEFQMMLAEFDASQLYITIPDFHETKKRYEALKKSVEINPCNRVVEVKEELDWLFSVEDKACKYIALHHQGMLPLRVTHNDTKINNVLFDIDSLKPLVIIDLDTVMPGLVGNDFGDAIRFAANFVEEDCPNIEKIGIDLNKFWAFADGFLSKTAKTLTNNEVETLALSCFALTCELATRFLTDYINGDVYFKTKYDKHNFIRTRAQIALAKDMELKMDAMNAICQYCYKKYK